jgi:hypothetical protein
VVHFAHLVYVHEKALSLVTVSFLQIRIYRMHEAYLGCRSEMYVKSLLPPESWLRHARPVAPRTNVMTALGKFRVHQLHEYPPHCWTAAEWQMIDDGVRADFTALTELEIRYSDVADHLLPPKLRCLVVCAIAGELPCSMKETRKLAEKLSKRLSLDITLNYLHYRKADQKICPRLHKLPAIFTESGLDLSLYVHPFIGPTCKSNTSSDVALVQANGKERVHDRTI